MGIDRVNKKAPCFICKDRQAGCHAVCERYGAWAKAQREKLDVLLKSKETYYGFRRKKK